MLRLATKSPLDAPLLQISLPKRTSSIPPRTLNKKIPSSSPCQSKPSPACSAKKPSPDSPNFELWKRGGTF
ncbi:hypothetical protein SLEP1_g40136 [Rubroshorea leprosula]|uniref:Uncharacterized protein n=1 Tax=Rubroshorea leprosula TaxID=152421 RepID=A0AAV5L3D2_9ROSI|nr:hypothetical protein SLEP1_g40136 [Rubroshorea leprosula]